MCRGSATVGVLLLCSTASGCHLLLQLDTAGPGEPTLPGDSGPGEPVADDASLDGGPGDLSAIDRTTRDRRPPDGQPKPGPDGADLWAKPDLPKLDGSKLDAGSPPCTTTKAFVAWSSGTGLVICRDSAYTATNHCKAEQLCNTAGGWFLCPASKYKVLVGIPSSMPTTPAAWIAGCVRESGGIPHAPTDARCGSCQTGSLSSITLSWTCATGNPLPTATYDNMGLQVDTKCQRVGANSSVYESLWDVLGAGASLTGAACCR